MSPNRVVPTSEEPNILFELVDGDLSLSGWGRNELAISSDPSGLEVESAENHIRVVVRHDASIQVPINCTLTLRRVHGDLSLSTLAGVVVLEEVTGDASVSNIGSLTIGNAGGDLSVRNVAGACTLGRVRGDASVSHIAGNLVIENVEEDLSISDVRGSVRAAGGDDVSLRVRLIAGCSYDVRANEDLTCWIPSESSARVSVSANKRLKVERLVDNPTITGNTSTFQLGDGEAALTLVAGEDLTLMGVSGEGFFEFNFDFGPEFSARFTDFSQQVATAFEDQVGEFARRLDEKIESMGGTEEVAARIQERIVAAARRIEEKIGEATRAAEARADASREEEARRYAAYGRTPRPEDLRRSRNRDRGGWGGWGNLPMPPAPQQPQKPGTPALGEEERMAVLRMVSEGKISVEQAERLLAALYGKPGGDD